MMIKISDYILQFLKEKQVKHIFMLPGGGAMHLIDSLGKSGIEYTCCQHEQAATIAAESYGQYTNELGVVMVTSGPGATNTITGVTAAWIDSTPMLIISGQAKRSDLVGNKGVRQIGSQEVQIVEMVKPITKYAIQVLETKRIKYYLERAYHEATTGRKGPVWIDIPLDVQAEEIDIDHLLGYSKPEITFKENIEEEAGKIISRIENSKRPLIIAGNGIYLSNAQNSFNQLLGKMNIPTQTTWKSIDLMYEEHPLYVGHPGALGDRGANFILQECDLLIALGARIDNSITAFNERDFANNAFKIIVDIDEYELKKFEMKIDLAINCDVGYLLNCINQKLESKKKKEFKDWLKYCKDIRNKYPVILSEYKQQKEFVNGYFFTEMLSSELQEGDIIVPESAGVTAEVTIQAFRNKKDQRMKHAAGLGSMGFGLPYAIGACIANDYKRTILIDGDGAFQLNIQELETLHRLQLPIKIFIWSNNGYASIRAMQQNNFNGNYVACGQSSGLTLPNIIAIAKAYGFRTYKINSNNEVERGIQEVLKGSDPVICEIKISPDEVVAPKVKPIIGENGKIIAGQLDYMWPFLEK